MGQDSKLEQIKERLAKATPGPWEVGGMDSGHSRYETNWWVNAGDFGDVVCDMDGLARTDNENLAKDDGWNDANLIAHAPEDLKALIAVVEDVQALHAPDAGHPPHCYCGEEEGSGRQCLTCYEEYPCATIRAIEAILHK